MAFLSDGHFLTGSQCKLRSNTEGAATEADAAAAAEAYTAHLSALVVAAVEAAAEAAAIKAKNAVAIREMDDDDESLCEEEEFEEEMEDMPGGPAERASLAASRASMARLEEMMEASGNAMDESHDKSNDPRHRRSSLVIAGHAVRGRRSSLGTLISV
jgi:hypothetical protein